MSFTIYTKLFNARVLPIMTYGCSVWCHVNCNKIQQIFFKGMRIFLGVHKFAPLFGIIGDMGCQILMYINT